MEDPVCGMMVTEESAVAAKEWDGVKYGFCCQHCFELFSKQPDKYIKNSVEQNISNQGKINLPEAAPDWIDGNPIHVLDGDEIHTMHARGDHPLNLVNQLMREIQTGEFILLKTHFKPKPMIEAMEKQNNKVYYTANDGMLHHTFIGKP